MLAECSVEKKAVYLVVQSVVLWAECWVECSAGDLVVWLVGYLAGELVVLSAVEMAAKWVE